MQVCLHFHAIRSQKTTFVSITIIQHNVYGAQIIPKLFSQVGPGGDNEKLANLLAGVADHLCQVHLSICILIFICLLVGVGPFP